MTTKPKPYSVDAAEKLRTACIVRPEVMMRDAISVGFTTACHFILQSKMNMAVDIARSERLTVRTAELILNHLLLTLDEGGAPITEEQHDKMMQAIERLVREN
jgi:hypothetical protein